MASGTTYEAPTQSARGCRGGRSAEDSDCARGSERTLGKARAAFVGCNDQLRNPLEFGDGSLEKWGIDVHADF